MQSGHLHGRHLVASDLRRAFDPNRPPEKDLIDDCVHCGFCLPTCPTYVLWGEEMDSPRGRIVLMNAGLEAGSEMSPEMVTHFDRCLGCMACVTACPSGVRYDTLIEETRPQIERNFPRPLRQRVVRRVMLALFTRPGWLRAAALLLSLRLHRSVARLRGRLGTMARLAPRASVGNAFHRLPARTPARGTRRARVGLLQGCVQRVFFPHVNEATVSVLAAEGFEVHAPPEVRCCGALKFHSGLESEAVVLAKRMIEAFEDCDFVVANAAGCGSAMKDYGGVLADDPVWSKRAGDFSTKVRDVTELLTEFEPVAPRRPLDLRVAYHDACHLAHAQGVRAQPRSLLQAIPGLEVVEPPEWELCCGSAGIYNLLEVDAGRELGERKAHNLLSVEPQVIAAGNPGCALQITAHLEALGRPLPLVHPLEIVAASIEGRSL
ncbi:MAG: 4Fe-4S dicluster domain-containing protein [Actinobacteria bacterium]|nr:4Fe-4S dicluster domain-containing protein [Actinomycetota bacterium]